MFVSGVDGSIAVADVLCINIRTPVSCTCQLCAL